MPIKNEDQLALEANGQKFKYCVMCYQDGQFLQSDVTVEEMREQCIEVMKKEMNMPIWISRILTRKTYSLDRWQ